MRTRGVAAILAGLAVLCLAGISPADVPSDLYSTVICSCAADAGTGVGSGAPFPWQCTICPGGDISTEDIWIHVVVRNHLNQPLQGSTVTTNAVLLDPNDDCMIWDNDGLPAGDPMEDPQTQVSNAAGQATFMYDEGGIGPLPPYNPVVFPNLDFLVTMVGPGPGAAQLPCQNQQLEVVGYDLDCDCIVGVIDLALFASVGWPGHLKCDFNHDGVVNIIDFAMFAASWGHACASQ